MKAIITEKETVYNQKEGVTAQKEDQIADCRL
jgi:hypothetical protein